MEQTWVELRTGSYYCSGFERTPYIGVQRGRILLEVSVWTVIVNPTQVCLRLHANLVKVNLLTGYYIGYIVRLTKD